METEFKFKAQILNSDKWVEGDLIMNNGSPIIIKQASRKYIESKGGEVGEHWYIDAPAYRVKPETIEQIHQREPLSMPTEEEIHSIFDERFKYVHKTDKERLHWIDGMKKAFELMSLSPTKTYWVEVPVEEWKKKNMPSGIYMCITPEADPPCREYLYLNDIREFDSFYKVTHVLEKVTLPVGGEKEEIDNGWISVEERLPENENERFIVAAKEGVMRETHSCYNGKWYCSISPSLIDSITHWQPLPPPPTSNLTTNKG